MGAENQMEAIDNEEWLLLSHDITIENDTMEKER